MLLPFPFSALDMVARFRRARLLRSALLVGTFGLGLASLGLVGAARAQDVARPPPAIGPNITQQVQSQAPVALPSLHPIVERVMPAVVNISVALAPDAAARIEDDNGEEGAAPDFPQGTPFDELLRRFFGENGLPPGLRPRPRPGEREVTALGSGFIIDPGGYIVTNNHIVGQAAKVTVIFQDNSKHPATIIGRDEKTDIALVKIEPKRPLPFVQWGDSDKAQVGDWVIAVGNPFGLGGSVTAGVISALGRDINAGPYDDFLQIDAPINRGNSGGPTFNLAGEVIGINTAIYSPSGGSVGIGFAIPSNLAKTIVAQLKDKGHVTRGWLGVSIQNVTPAIARSLGLDPDNPQGALIASVEKNSPAATAGLKDGDVITTANGYVIRTTHDLRRLVARTPVGRMLDLTVRRQGHEERITATVAAMPETPRAAAGRRHRGPASPATASALGLQLAELTPELRQRLNVPDDVQGVAVRDVAEDSPAAAAGVQEGDVIMSVDQQPVATPEEAAKRLREAAAKGQVLLLLNRRGANRFVGLSVASRYRG